MERFISFVENSGHNGEEMEKCVIKVFTGLDINLQDCRGQKYDHVYNMSGICSGLQCAFFELDW